MSIYLSILIVKSESFLLAFLTFSPSVPSLSHSSCFLFLELQTFVNTTPLMSWPRHPSSFMLWRTCGKRWYPNPIPNPFPSQPLTCPFPVAPIHIRRRRQREQDVPGGGLAEARVIQILVGWAEQKQVRIAPSTVASPRRPTHPGVLHGCSSSIAQSHTGVLRSQWAPTAPLRGSRRLRLVLSAREVNFF
jgi:hypothetical protein